MIEQWCASAWSRGRPAAARVLGRMRGVRPGVWIVLVAALSVAGRVWPGFYERQVGHRGEIADAIGSVGFFYGPPQPDHAGGRVLYLRTSEKGMGLYACDVASGKKTRLKEWKPAGGSSMRGQGLLPLSPDGRFVPLVVSIAASRGAVAICDAGSGDELTRIQGRDWVVTEGVWLTARKLAWLRKRRLGAGRPAAFQLHLTEKRPNGSWVDKTVPLAETNVSCLSAVSDDTVAWMDAKGVYALNLASNAVSTLFGPEGRPIAEMSYSRERRQFLVTCGEKGGWSLWRLELRTNAAPEFTWLTSDKRLRLAQWVNDGRGFAYLREHTLVVKADATAKRTPVRAAVESLTAAPSGGGLYFVGSVGGEPGLGLWRYDTGNQSLTNLVCYSDRPSARARRVEPIHCATKADGGRRLTYYLYRPANFNWRRKYPMLIGDTLFGQFAYQRDFDGPSWAEAMANCGAYVVIVERQTWFPKNDKEWGLGVMTAYEQFKDDPTVDRGRIFLFGVSAETRYTSRLLQERPELWKGVVFMNPGVLPEMSAIKARTRLPRVLFSAGKEEGELGRFKRFQEEGCARGVFVEFVEHPGASHVLTSIPATRERIQAMKHFIFEE